MGDDRPVDPLDALEAEAKDEVDLEFVRAMRASRRKHEREQAAETTDDEGNPLPRLDFDAAPSEVEDPLLAVGHALLPHLPDGWVLAILNLSAAAEEVRMFAFATGAAMSPLRGERVAYLPDVAEACARLRRAMYEPDGRGAWYTLFLRLNANGTIVARYDYDDPPFLQWGPDDAALLVRDHELYPRPQERLPAWHPSR